VPIANNNIFVTFGVLSASLMMLRGWLKTIGRGIPEKYQIAMARHKVIVDRITKGFSNTKKHD